MEEERIKQEAENLFQGFTKKLSSSGKKIALKHKDAILYYLERVAQIQIRVTTYSDNPELDRKLITQWTLAAEIRIARVVDEIEQEWKETLEYALGTALELAAAFANSYVTSKINQS